MNDTNFHTITCIFIVFLEIYIFFFLNTLLNSKNNIDQLLLTKSYVITETSYNSDIQ